MPSQDMSTFNCSKIEAPSIPGNMVVVDL